MIVSIGETKAKMQNIAVIISMGKTRAKEMQTNAAMISIGGTETKNIQANAVAISIEDGSQISYAFPTRALVAKLVVIRNWL